MRNPRRRRAGSLHKNLSAAGVNKSGFSWVHEHLPHFLMNEPELSTHRAPVSGQADNRRVVPAQTFHSLNPGDVDSDCKPLEKLARGNDHIFAGVDRKQQSFPRRRARRK